MRPSFIFLFTLLLLAPRVCRSQFNWIEIGVDGLTCSQCSRSVEMSVKKLDFVKDVQMDLEHTHGKITFKPGARVRVEKIARAVEDAGFSVRYLKADLMMGDVALKDGDCFPFENRTYQLIKTGEKAMKGEVQVKFIGKDFLPRSEYRSWKEELKPKYSQQTEKLFYVTAA